MKIYPSLAIIKNAVFLFYAHKFFKNMDRLQLSFLGDIGKYQSTTDKQSDSKRTLFYVSTFTGFLFIVFVCECIFSIIWEKFSIA